MYNIPRRTLAAWSAALMLSVSGAILAAPAPNPVPNLVPTAAHSTAPSGATRTEHDLLGEKQVPASAYYGVQTARALENFQISNVKMNTYPEFVEAYAIVKL